DAEDDVGALDLHAAADDVEVEEPDVLGRLAGGGLVEDELGDVEPHHLRHTRQELAGDALHAGEVDAAAERLDVAGGQVVAAAGHQRDAGALDVGDVAGALVDVGRPDAAAGLGEGVEAAAGRLGEGPDAVDRLGVGGERRAAGAEGLVGKAAAEHLVFLRGGHRVQGTGD